MIASLLTLHLFGSLGQLRGKLLDLAEGYDGSAHSFLPEKDECTKGSANFESVRSLEVMFLLPQLAHDLDMTQVDGGVL